MSFLLYFACFIVGQVALTLVLYMASFIVPKAAFAARSLAAYMALVVTASCGVIISIAMRLAGSGQSAQWATGRVFKFLMAAATGITFEIEDPDKHLDTVRPAVFVGNHQTELDVLMLGCMFPKYCAVTAKKSLKSWPFLGWFMALSGTVFIDRKNSTDARAAMAKAATEMKQLKQSKGAFHLAVQAGVPIVPVVVANYSHVLYVKSFIFNSGKIPVKVLDPIPTTGLTAADVDELTRSTREVMLQELVVLSSKAQKRPMPVPSSNGGNGVVKASGAEATIS
ncbi:acyltransferase [Apiospora hydei]|uniref:Acyltransferase n=1 Tax=Apiospora hydei TaxID=1337664 RepID=A0ABR1WZX2_9PEZI